MFSKLNFIALISIVIAAPQHHTAAQFPAGVDPSKCPNFPICDNAVLHNQQPSLVKSAPSSWNSQPTTHQPSQWNQPQPQWNQPQPQQPQPQWNQPQPHQQQWNNQPQQSQWNSQPQQQSWNQPPQSWNQASHQAPSNHLSNDQHSSDDDLSGTGGDKYPAGVNPQSCPNYPYCDNAVNGHESVAATPAPKTGYISEREYPAGVSPHTCPNFPYCN